MCVHIFIVMARPVPMQVEDVRDAVHIARQCSQLWMLQEEGGIKMPSVDREEMRHWMMRPQTLQQLQGLAGGGWESEE